MIVYLGMLITFIAIIAAIYLAIKTLLIGIDVEGWFTLFVSMWFIAGMIMMVMGIVAIYIGNIFIEIKNRPTYIIERTLNAVH
jgi:dolichol-phosphate mannosyltransferase